MKIKNVDIRIVKGRLAGLPVVSGDVNEHTVRAACAGIIAKSAAEGSDSITLPPLGCGPGGFPLVGCAKIISQEILRVIRTAHGVFKKITVRVDTDEAFQVFEKQVFGYLRHVTEDLCWGPYVCADIIIEVSGGIVIIERTNPPFGWALPGGFVDSGESLEAAARREAKEETDLDVMDLRQFHTYSDPSRDPRFHTITTVFTAKGVGEPKAGDDAKGLKIVPFAALRGMKFAFDHNKVIDDYCTFRGI